MIAEGALTAKGRNIEGGCKRWHINYSFIITETPARLQENIDRGYQNQRFLAIRNCAEINLSIERRTNFHRLGRVD